jgi:hypothetical protein
LTFSIPNFNLSLVYIPGKNDQEIIGYLLGVGEMDVGIYTDDQLLEVDQTVTADTPAIEPQLATHTENESGQIAVSDSNILQAELQAESSSVASESYQKLDLTILGEWAKIYGRYCTYAVDPGPLVRQFAEGEEKSDWILQNSVIDKAASQCKVSLNCI